MLKNNVKFDLQLNVGMELIAVSHGEQSAFEFERKIFYSDFSNCVIEGGWVYKLPVVTGVKSAVVEQSSTSRSYSS